jgi:ACS family sodium-dependent inorganic phosphate cotransporter
MSHQYGWNSSTAGLVQSSFFWGYALSQLPGGWLAKLIGGRFVWGNITSFTYIDTNTNFMFGFAPTDIYILHVMMTVISSCPVYCWDI